MEQLAPLEFELRRLENGLEVILFPSRQSPLVHVTVHYRVGSSYEEPGHSGFAHLFEHLMFQGSENVGKNEHGRLVDEAGGHWNATTNKDRTNYYQTLPSNCLELGLWLEADRLRALNVTAENFENQRQTVIEEKKQSYDNQPYGTAYLKFDESAYGNWRYGHPIIGSVEDLEKATLDDAREFHRTHYGPDNAVLVVAGDFERRNALDWIDRFFGTITHKTQTTPPDLTEPEQQSEKSLTVKDPLAVLPAVFLGYHMPALGTPEHYALSVLSMVLSQGRSSRLYRELTFERNWITSLSCGPSLYRGPQLFSLVFLVQSHAKTKEVLPVVFEQLARVTREPIPDAELEKAKNHLTNRFISGRNKVAGIGESLARYSIYHGDAGLINRDLQRFLDVTQHDILQAAQSLFKDTNRTLLLVVPETDRNATRPNGPTDS